MFLYSGHHVINSKMAEHYILLKCFDNQTEQSLICQAKLNGWVDETSKDAVLAILLYFQTLDLINDLCGGYLALSKSHN